MAQYKRLGEILISEAMISQKQLQEAIDSQGKSGIKLGEVLVDMGAVTEDQIVVALSKQLEIPYVTLSSGKLKANHEQHLEDMIPYGFAVKNLVLPIAHSLNSLTIAIFDPLDLILIDNLKKLTSCEINPIISTRSDILKAIEEFYGKQRALMDAVDASFDDETESANSFEIGSELSLDKLIAKTEEAPVVKLVDLLIRQAIEENASDIHVEPQRDKLSLRYRVDGNLYEVSPPSKSMKLALISRIKILSKMNIAEKRLPQDGGFTVKMEKRLIDLRVSSVPTIYGEKIVMRILDKARVPLDLSKLGFFPDEREMIKRGISASFGLVFLTGPTGSGKSTTLYSCLNSLNDASTNITTIEDPVEYRLDGINQVQVKADIGLTFSNVLRAFLRQDPDVILVGEVRDLETAEICVRAALTGHLVLSTLHTNTAAGSIVRLVDMGIPNYLIGSSLRLIVAQRLVRVLCPHCKEPYEVAKHDLPKNIILDASVLYKPKGCQKCNFIGMRGRTNIGEIILVDDEIKDAIFRNVSATDLVKLARTKGTTTLLESGLRRVAEGTTSLEEILSLAA